MKNMKLIINFILCWTLFAIGFLTVCFALTMARHQFVTAFIDVAGCAINTWAFFMFREMKKDIEK